MRQLRIEWVTDQPGRGLRLHRRTRAGLGKSLAPDMAGMLGTKRKTGMFNRWSVGFFQGSSCLRAEGLPSVRRRSPVAGVTPDAVCLRGEMP